jgi:O-antigen/teichoic acid export membrane protein
MGIVVKQSFWNSIWLYLGIIIGAINTVFLFPKCIDPDQFGLTRLLISIAMIFSQFSMLGAGSIVIRYLPFFRDEKKHHNGMLFFVVLLSLIGIALVSLVLLLSQDMLLSKYEGRSTMFVDHYYFLFPLIAFLVLFNIFAAYIKALLKSVFQLFLREFLLRLILTFLLIAAYFEYINFQQFILYYVLSYGVITVLLVIYIALQKQLLLKPDFSKFNKPFKKEVSLYGFFTLVAGLSGNLAGNIDVVMIGAMSSIAVAGGNESLGSVAIYSLGAYVATVIALPARSIQTISLPLVAQAWKENSIEKISELYYKTSVNQMLFGVLLFIGIWANVDNLFRIIPEYSDAKYIILFIGLGRLYDVASGINGGIINTSKYYWFTTVSIGFLAIVTIITNLMLIPLYGIIGAAIATSIAILLHNVFKLIFLYWKYKIQPFSMKSMLVLILGVAVLAVSYLIPQLDNIMLDILARSVVITIIYIPLAVSLKLSEDFNKVVFLVLSKLGIKK